MKTKPVLLEKPNLEDLIKSLQAYIDFYETYPTEGHEDLQSDYEYPILANCVNAFFGDDVYDYINQQTNEYDKINYPHIKNE